MNSPVPVGTPLLPQTLPPHQQFSASLCEFTLLNTTRWDAFGKAIKRYISENWKSFPRFLTAHFLVLQIYLNSGCHHKILWTQCLNNRLFISHSFGDWKSEIRELVAWVLGESCLSGLQTAAFCAER